MGQFFVCILKLECIHASVPDHSRDDVFVGIVGAGVLGIGQQLFPDRLRVE